MLNAFKSFYSGIQSKYSVGKSQFQVGPWSVHSGKRKGGSTSPSPSSASTDSPLVSVFTFDKKAFASFMNENGVSSKRVLEEVYDRLRRDVASLSKFRHPNVVRVIEPLEESKTSMSFVTEPLRGCLNQRISRSGRSSNGAGGFGADSDYDDEFNDLAIQRGLLQILEALIFLHQTAKAVHLDVQPSSVLIDAKGDWKLAGMAFIEKYEDSSASDYFIPQYDPRLPPFVQINLDYAAPELVLDRKLDPANDIFSLGCLALTIYCGAAPMATHNNPSSYREEFQSISRYLRTNASSLPAYLSNSVIPGLLTRNPIERMSLEAFRQSEYFDNPLVKTINFLDDFPARLPQEKKVFLSGLYGMLDQFPKAIKQRKILQALIDELASYSTSSSSSPNPTSGAGVAAAAESGLVYPLLKIILTIGQDMSQLGFTERILPAIRRVDKQIGCQTAVLDFLDILISRLNADDYKKCILPILFVTLSAGEPERQRDVLMKIRLITEKTDYVCLKNDVFPAVAEVFTKTTSLAVKLEALNAFSVLLERELDKYMVTEKMIPLLAKMKTRDPHIIMASLKVYSRFKGIVDVEVLVTAVIPQLLTFSIESTLTPEQFSQLMQEVRVMIDKLEADRKKKLIHNVGPALPSTSSTSLNTPKVSRSGSSTPVDFNSLISQGSANRQQAQQQDTSNLASIAPMKPASSSISSIKISPPTSNGSSSVTPLQTSTIANSGFSTSGNMNSNFIALQPTTNNSLSTNSGMLSSSSSGFKPLQPASSSMISSSMTLSSSHASPSVNANSSRSRPSQPIQSQTSKSSSFQSLTPTRMSGSFATSSFGATNNNNRSSVTSQSMQVNIKTNANNLNIAAKDDWGDFHDSPSSPPVNTINHQKPSSLSQYQSLL